MTELGKMVETGTYEHVHFYWESSRELFARWPWRGAGHVAFSLDGSALAVTGTKEPGVYFARAQDWAPVT